MLSQPSFPMAARISELERSVGRLSPVQKMLLGTDGSVTSLLEVITGSPVEIETLVQEIVLADQSVAEELKVNPGDEVNYRVVKLKRADTQETLIYAVSHTPLGRLEPGFKDDMMRADIPIGVILKKHKIESRRDLLGAKALQADGAMSRVFKIFNKELLLSRDYRVVRNGKPLISITETFPYNQFQDEHRVVVQTPSRIHMTLIDLSGRSGRVDGGIGIALDEPSIVVEAERSRDLTVEGNSADADRVRNAIQAVLKSYGIVGPGAGARVSIRGDYKAHVGLGSGTQMAIAAGRAVCSLYDKSVSTREIAVIVNRGGTSGIGTAAFDLGGFIMDGGHSFGSGKDKTDFRPSSASHGVKPPHVIARYDFPRDWRIVLAIPNLPKGAHGQREVDVFRDYCPVPLEDVHELCYQIMMKMAPAVVEGNLDDFGQAVNRVQELGFKKVEVDLQHPLVKGLMEGMREAGAACSGLSSFGPTVYAIADSQVRDVEALAREAMEEVGGEVLITKARNEGARVRAV